MGVNNVLGIIFSNMHEKYVRDLTDVRTMGSVPFGGRYRLIDFTLSNMVNAKINKVGIIAKSNYKSLMDHVGSGKSWDLARKNGGLYILPPFSASSSGFYKNRIEALYGIESFLTHAKEELVLLSDCNVIANIDMAEVIDKHAESSADITFICKRGRLKTSMDNVMTFTTDDGGRVNEIRISPEGDDERIICLDMYVIKKSLLIDMIRDATSGGYDNLYKDVFQRLVDKLVMNTYVVDTASFVIDSMQHYVDANRALLDCDIRRQLFNNDRPVYTKVRDEMPVRYGLGSKVSNCLVADGCVIEGKVENSIIFRGVKIGKGSVVKNSIVMQSADIGEGVSLDCVTLDKNVTITDGKSLKGSEAYQVFVSKGATV